MSLSSTEDEELVRRRQRLGDDEALAELIRRHYARVRAVVYPILLSDAAADDVTQEVFVRVLRKIDGFRGASRFSTWLHRVAVNTCYDHLRRESRRGARPLDEAKRGDGLADPATAPDEAANQRELNERIERAMRRLSPKLRAALTLVVIDGKSPTEAAEIEGCKAATIHWRVHEARRKLNGMLGDVINPSGEGDPSSNKQ